MLIYPLAINKIRNLIAACKPGVQKNDKNLPAGSDLHYRRAVCYILTAVPETATINIPSRMTS